MTVASRVSQPTPRHHAGPWEPDGAGPSGAAPRDSPELGAVTHLPSALRPPSPAAGCSLSRRPSFPSGVRLYAPRGHTRRPSGGPGLESPGYYPPPSPPRKRQAGTSGVEAAGGAGKSARREVPGRAGGRGAGRAGGGGAGRPISSWEPDGRETKRRPSAWRLRSRPALASLAAGNSSYLPSGRARGPCWAEGLLRPVVPGDGARSGRPPPWGASGRVGFPEQSGPGRAEPDAREAERAARRFLGKLFSFEFLNFVP